MDKRDWDELVARYMSLNYHPHTEFYTTGRQVHEVGSTGGWFAECVTEEAATLVADLLNALQGSA